MPLLVAAAIHRLGPLRQLYDPEDLVQDAWLVTLPRIADFIAADGRHTPVLLRFLTTTLAYRISNLTRKHIRGSLQEPHEVGATSDGPMTTDTQTSVVAGIVKRETQNLVRTCIDELEEKDRQILILREIEHLPNQAVATILPLTPQAVAMRYRRAIERLRDRLPGSVFDEIPEA
jgi:RNA polymerase sigma-70 factor (ECF subfamily)